MVLKFPTKQKDHYPIGINVQRCPVCNRPLSFRDEVPFCRSKFCIFSYYWDDVCTHEQKDKLLTEARLEV